MLDSPPALGTRAASCCMICSSREPSTDDNPTDKEISSGNSRRTRRSLVDQVDELVERAPIEDEWEPKNVAEVEPDQICIEKNQGTSNAVNIEADLEVHNVENQLPVNEGECSNANTKRRRGRKKLSSLAKKNEC